MRENYLNLTEAVPLFKILEKDIHFSSPASLGEPPIPSLDQNPNIGQINSNSCGISWNRDDSKFDIEDAPWMVQLRYNETYLQEDFNCAGVLISGCS